VFFLLSLACVKIIRWPSSSGDFASAELDIELPPGGTLEDTARVSGRGRHLTGISRG